MEKILNTPLFEEHLKLKALMAPFAGWNMPIHYGSIIEEAKATRQACAIFDICHMGEFIVNEKGGKSFDASLTVPVNKMKAGVCKYGFLLKEDGGVLDDLIVYREEDDRWMVVVNAGTIEKDFETIKSRLAPGAQITNISGHTAKFDVQGPLSREIMVKAAGSEIDGLKYFRFIRTKIDGTDALISRTGYTGELGYEVYIESDKALPVWQLLTGLGAKPVGLGARDILRLEAGLPLYTDELTEETNPMEAAMERFIDFEKEFTGKAALINAKTNGLKRKLCALTVNGRRTPRHGNKVKSEGAEAGIVTSGVFSPHLNCGICFAYVDPKLAALGTKLEIEFERGSAEATVSETPFIKDTSIKK